jgi:hypothetical protein
MKLSIHDNFLVSYEVLHETREICLHTEYRDVALDAPFEYTDVIFRGVFAYHFTQDNFSNILFGIDETTTENILADNKALFEAGERYGWPGIWNRSDATLRAYLTENQARGFEISSSFGMYGWVLARSMEFIAAMPSAMALTTDGSESRE